MIRLIVSVFAFLGAVVFLSVAGGALASIVGAAGTSADAPATKQFVELTKFGVYLLPFVGILVVAYIFGLIRG